MYELERREDGTIVFRGQDPDPAELAMHRQWAIDREAKNRMLYARWLERNEAQRVRDRKVRAFLIGVGIAVTVIVLGMLTLAVWWIIGNVANVGLIFAGLCVVLLALPLLGRIGQVCITTVIHKH
jgi:hypothetical protein